MFSFAITSTTQANENSIDVSIENFFTNWFKSEVTQRYKNYLPKLMDKSFQAKVNMSEDELKIFLDSIQSVKPNTQPVSLTPYFINRVLLHAIIYKPEITSILFTRTFISIANFLKENLHDDDLEQSEKIYFRASYRGLERQISYLLDCHEAKLSPGTHPADRPHQMILLPNQIKTPTDWLTIAEDLDKDLLKIIYFREEARINQAFYRYGALTADLINYQGLKRVIACFPIKLEKILYLLLNSCEDWLRPHHMPNALLDFQLYKVLTELPTRSLRSLLKHSRYLQSILGEAPFPIVLVYLLSLPEQARLDFIRELTRSRLHRSFFKYINFQKVYFLLPTQDRSIFLNLFNQENFKRIITNYLSSKKEEDYQPIESILEIYIKNFPQDDQDLLDIITKLPVKMRVSAIAHCPAKIFANSFRHRALLSHMFLELFPIKSRFKVLYKQVGMTAVLNYFGHELNPVKAQLPKDDQKKFINLINPNVMVNKINEHPDNSFNSLIEYMADLNESNQNAFIANNSSDFFERHISFRAYPLTELLESLKPSNRYFFITQHLDSSNKIKPDFISKICTLLTTLNHDERRSFVSQYNFADFKKAFLRYSLVNYAITSFFGITNMEFKQALSLVPWKQRIFDAKEAKMLAIYNILTGKFIVKPQPESKASWWKYLTAAVLIVAAGIVSGIVAGLTIAAFITLSLFSVLAITKTYLAFFKNKAPQANSPPENANVNCASTTSSLTQVLLSNESKKPREALLTTAQPLRSTKYTSVATNSIFSRKTTPTITLNEQGGLVWNRQVPLRT